MSVSVSQMAVLLLGRRMKSYYWQCHFLKHVANWISLNLSVYLMRVWILFVLCWFYFLDRVVICSIFTGNSKSCGLPPECNIHCYVLDVSMPKHTMHCTPDLVTVLPWRFIYGLFMWLCCWLVDLKPPSAVFPSWHVNVCILVWGFVCG